MNRTEADSLSPAVPCPLCGDDHLPGTDPGDAGASSPCTLVCVLDASGTCLGCHRTEREIETWATMSAADRQAAMHQVERRRRPQIDRVAENAPEGPDPTPEPGPA